MKNQPTTPFIIFVISYVVLNDVTKAGVFTTIAMMLVMIISIMFTGLRGTFKF